MDRMKLLSIRDEDTVDVSFRRANETLKNELDIEYIEWLKSGTKGIGLEVIRANVGKNLKPSCF